MLEYPSSTKIKVRLPLRVTEILTSSEGMTNTFSVAVSTLRSETASPLSLKSSLNFVPAGALTEISVPALTYVPLAMDASPAVTSSSSGNVTMYSFSKDACTVTFSSIISNT